MIPGASKSNQFTRLRRAQSVCARGREPVSTPAGSRHLIASSVAKRRPPQAALGLHVLPLHRRQAVKGLFQSGLAYLCLHFRSSTIRSPST